MFEENCSMERNSLEQSNNKQMSCRFWPLKIPPAASKNTAISGFGSEADENCFFWVITQRLDGTYRLSRNVAKKLPLFAT